MNLYLTKIDTQIGNMISIVSNDSLLLLEFEDRKDIDSQMLSLQELTDGSIYDTQADYHKIVKFQLNQYFDKKLEKFDLNLQLIGTEFQVKVWTELEKVPYGKTMSYLELSRKLGDEKAIRAVANANAKNKIAIIIPCHRIIGSDSKLVGYAGGIKRKKFLLDFESDLRLF